MYQPEHGVDLVALFRDEFKMCKLSKGDKAAILSGYSAPGMPGPWRYRREYIDAAFRAFREMDINAFHLELPPVLKPSLPLSPKARSAGTAGVGTSALGGLTSALGALKDVDFVLDLTMSLFSPELAEIVAGGPKVLIVCEGPEASLRLFPSEDLKRRLESAERRMAKGGRKTLRITSDAGTDVTMDLGQYATFIECGFAPEKARWDAFPSGQVGCFPDDGSGEGVFVIDSGDQVVLPYQVYIQQPVKMFVRDGYIREIEGGADARLMRDHLESWEDPEVYALGHQSLGLHPNARWDALSVYGWDTMGMDSRIFYGGFLLGTGPNTLGGGVRNTPCHFDIAMRNCTIEIDGEVLIDRGEVVAPDLRAPANT